MSEGYVSYEQAVKLKAAGFDWECARYYCAFDNEADIRFWSIHPAQSQNRLRAPKDKVIADAPTLWQAQKWLREEKGIAINVLAHDGGKYDYDIVFLPNAEECDCDIDRSPWYRKYESALSDGITAALKLIEKKGE